MKDLFGFLPSLIPLIFISTLLAGGMYLVYGNLTPESISQRSPATEYQRNLIESHLKLSDTELHQTAKQLLFL